MTMTLRTILKFSFLLNIFIVYSQNYSEIGNHDFNDDWGFKLIENTGTYDSGLYKDWTKINVPHDWSVDFSFDSIKGEGATGYLPGGRGLYKKEFIIQDTKPTTTYVLFDGVYNNSTFYLNDKHVGFHPYGYSPFYFDISDYLNRENGKNIIKVDVDRSKYVDSRWYSGSGIYRNVRLVRKNNLHIPIWGVFVTTPQISDEEAIVNIKSTIKNKHAEDQKFNLQIKIFDDTGKIVAKVIEPLNIASKKDTDVENKLSISKPYLWGIKSPRRYEAEITLLQGEEIIDKNTVKFGVRKIKFDTNKGFFLNDINIPIKGVCLHHDGGIVGSAVPKDVWRRRLMKLKDAGCNAIRISHNPGSDEFLDLCDEMGFLVQDEFFDEWDNPKDKRLNQNEQIVDSISRGYTEYFQEWAEKDLKNTILAHRNHPSIFQWSIGNEIEWTYPRNADATGFFNNMNWSGNYFWEKPPHSVDQIKEKLATLPEGKYDIGKTAKMLAAWTRELDTTRYVTANCILPSASHLSGFADVLDVVGYSYRRVLYDYGHENYPDKPIMGTENLVQWHEWKAVQERPFISGAFLWTGIDYMGESHEQWPRKATPSGMLDVAGFEKPSFHMMKTLWSGQPHIYVATQKLDKSIFKEEDNTGSPVERKKGAWKKALWVWHDVNEHWNYKENEKIVVEIYSNYDEVELCLNEKSIGVKKLKDFEDRIYKWILPFQKGELKITGKKDGKVGEIKILKTTGKRNKIKLITDKEVMNADGISVAHVIAQLEDINGNPIKNIEDTITFSVDGNVTVLGVDNGSPFNVQDYKSNTIKTDKGRCLLLIQSKKTKSKVTVKAAAKGLISNELKINIK
ncbi:glycoside hydrolase family 2 TIM barrel-domain containing protein [uncultured Aquimarina sp.]|uniref:glycoside hydrolase family 2 TIM barrel-domain containing protein n=1 Tax=uncultured Aquimarina sp. TaxID=575652 RepID=UPI00263881FD|nr:glycoside hydrolase family 2 TIM barrel-domain containing protein [uncultured Aquimarina sp.]